MTKEKLSRNLKEWQGWSSGEQVLKASSLVPQDPSASRLSRWGCQLNWSPYVWMAKRWPRARCRSRACDEGRLAMTTAATKPRTPSDVVR